MHVVFGMTAILVMDGSSACARMSEQVHLSDMFRQLSLHLVFGCIVYRALVSQATPICSNCVKHEPTAVPLRFVFLSNRLCLLSAHAMFHVDTCNECCYGWYSMVSNNTDMSTGERILQNNVDVHTPQHKAGAQTPRHCITM